VSGGPQLAAAAITSKERQSHKESFIRGDTCSPVAYSQNRVA
jgi:hypothetical protein